MTPKKTRTLPSWMMGSDSSKTVSPKAATNGLNSRRYSDTASEPGPSSRGVVNINLVTEGHKDKLHSIENLSDEEDRSPTQEAPRTVGHLVSDVSHIASDSCEDKRPIFGSEDNTKVASDITYPPAAIVKDIREIDVSTSQNVAIVPSPDPSIVPGVASSSTTSPSQAPPVIRKSCYYGSSCYRKNPQHRIDFSHPGDADYDIANSSNAVGSSSDNRPLCEYGAACYRKNPQHRLDFRHDAPENRKARPTTIQDIPSDDDGDFNESLGSDDFSPDDSETDDSFVTSDSMASGNSDFDPEDEEENEKKAKKRKKTKVDKKKGAKKRKD